MGHAIPRHSALIGGWHEARNPVGMARNTLQHGSEPFGREPSHEPMRARCTTTGSFGMSEGWDEETDQLTRVLVTPAEASSPNRNEPPPALESLPKSIRTISKASGSEWESADTELAPSLRGSTPWPSSQWSTALGVEPQIESTPRMPWIARTTPEPNGFRPVDVPGGSPFRRPLPLTQDTSALQKVPTQANSLWHDLRGRSRVAHGLSIAFALSILTLGLVLVSTWGHSDVRVDRLVAAFIDPSRDPRYEPASTVESAPQPLPAVLPVATVESAPQPMPAAPDSVAAPESPLMPVPTASAPNVAPVAALESPKPKPVVRTKPTGKPLPAKGASKQTAKKTRGLSAAEDLAQRQLLQSAL
jgi:hypothetical protein